ncbi:uncharacterized protein KD926_002983 [Aspergillus affinis]|uniref:uncharacterized protein n=1 Tax=Aspergillus affinis TaxID=1070780 RepID=UPI0022FEC431|nr:uncharacterized protein KD926_002983 [Aspergillus affinis]KAI9035702.1 hypothetical protein KD926_002983 [Aspergillus affinis]
MRFSRVALVGLAAVVSAELSTWNDVVGNVPKCMKTCLNDFYTKSGFEDECGSSGSAAVDCLCGVKDSFSDVQDAGEELSSCITNGCSTSDLTDASSQISGFQSRLTSIMDQCTKQESANGAVSVVPSFNTMLASGAVLLIGAAL